MEVITILPIVVPPIVLAAGLSDMQASAPLWMVKLFFNHPLTCLAPIYTVMAMPLVYRSIDNGLRAIDLHTLVDASRSLGCGWTGTMLRVILPERPDRGAGRHVPDDRDGPRRGRDRLAAALQHVPDGDDPAGHSRTTPQASRSPMTLVALVFTFLLLFSLTFLARRRGARTTG